MAAAGQAGLLLLPWDALKLLGGILASRDSLDAVCMSMTCRTGRIAFRMRPQVSQERLLRGSSDEQIRFAGVQLGLSAALNADARARDAAVRSGRVSAMDIMPAACVRFGEGSRLLAVAAAAGQEASIEWLLRSARESGQKLDARRAMLLAARHGRAGPLRLLYGRGFRLGDRTSIIQQAVAGGDELVLRWLADRTKPGDWACLAVGRSIAGAPSMLRVLGFLSKSGLLVRRGPLARMLLRLSAEDEAGDGRLRRLLLGVLSAGGFDPV